MRLREQRAPSAEVRSPRTFACVRVRAVSGSSDPEAYHCPLYWKDPVITTQSWPAGMRSVVIVEAVHADLDGFRQDPARALAHAHVYKQTDERHQFILL
jgi:hypothetical protein